MTDMFDTFMQGSRKGQPTIRLEADQDEELRPVEYMHVRLDDGEMVRVNRHYDGHRFTDDEALRLTLGHDVTIDTDHWLGVRGEFDWSTYGEQEYYGFAPWDASSYTTKDAPMPRSFASVALTDEEIGRFRDGETLTLTRTNDKGSMYGVRVTFMPVPDTRGDGDVWRLHGHYDDFSVAAGSLTEKTCPFLPVFASRVLTHDEIAHLRDGKTLGHHGTSRAGRPYTCTLRLGRDMKKDGRWAIMPIFR